MVQHWPIIPDHITLKERSDHSFTFSGRLVGQGVLKNDLIRGILTTITGRLFVPFVLVEFPAKETETPIVTKVKLSKFMSCEACTTFKTKTFFRYCSRESDLFTRCFKGLRETNFVAQLKSRITSVFAADKDSNYLFWNIEKVRDRYVFEHDCRFLGYRVLMLPIFFQKRMLGILVSDGILLESSIKDSTRHPFSRSERTMMAYFSENQMPCSLLEDCMAQHYRYIEHHPDRVHSDSEYHTIKSKAIEELVKIERHIHDEMVKIRQRYVRILIRNTLKKFNRLTMEDQLRKNTSISSFWGIVGKMIQIFREELNLDYIVILGFDSIYPSGGDALHVVAAAFEKDARSIKRLMPLTYDLSSVLELLGQTYSNLHEKEVLMSTKYPELFSGFNPAKLVRESSSLVRLFLSELTPHGSFVILTKYKPDVWSPFALDSREISKYLEQQFRYFYSFVSKSLSSLLEISSRLNMENSLRIFKHEAGQLTSGISSCSSLYLSSASRIRNLLNDDLEYVAHNVKSYILQLDFLIQKATSPLKALETSNSSFRIYREVLYKWSKYMTTETEHKGMSIHVPRVSGDDKRYPDICADKLLVEQLIYNLLDNARKYGFEGTNIYLSAKIIEGAHSDLSYYQICVRNFGLEVERPEKVFDLYFRGGNAAKEEGTGIGLFHCKKIVDAHGGDIWAECQRLSDVNLAYIKPALTYDTASSSAEELKRLRAIMQAIESDNTYRRVVAQNRKGGQRFFPDAFSVKDASLWKTPTYEVTFYVNIPQPGGGK